MMRKGIFFLSALFAFVVSCNQQQEGIPAKPTFSEHIAPIIYTNCTPCHHKGGAAPFSLMTYHEVKRKKKTIVKVTQSGYMPPWPADPGYSHFTGEKTLTALQKNIIKKWVETGAEEGDPARLPAEPVYSFTSSIGKPDLVLQLDTIKVYGNNRDRFLIVKVPFELPADTFIRALEFIAGKNNLVHHMNGHLLTYEDARKSDVFKGKRVINLETPSDAAYVAAFDSMQLYNDDGTRPRRIHSAVNYLPGVEAQLYPEGIGGYRVNRKCVLVANDIHYGPQPKDYMDVSSVNVFFGRKPPERPIEEIMLGTNGVAPVVPPLVIPAGKVKKFTSSYVLPADISVLTLNPHMHLLGKSFKAWAVKPTGDTVKLISIPKWDFRWQYFYTFPKMIPLPAGSVIQLEAYFDNTSANPNNPNRPPKQVAERLDRGGAGMRTTDEMLQFIITCVPYKAGDENISLK